jgi:hypothetical protein
MRPAAGASARLAGKAPTRAGDEARSMEAAAQAMGAEAQHQAGNLEAGAGYFRGKVRGREREVADCPMAECLHVAESSWAVRLVPS